MLAFVDTMNDNEAILISGAPRCSEYSGYLNTFRFQGVYEDPGLASGSFPSTLAIDASEYCGLDGSLQFDKQFMMRDLNKALVGFRGHSNRQPDCPPHRSESVSTGAWGCGVFGGHPLLKFLQQWMAASTAGVKVMYFSAFEREKLAGTLTEMVEHSTAKGRRVCDIYEMLCAYNPSFESFERYITRLMS